MPADIFPYISMSHPDYTDYIWTWCLHAEYQTQKNTKTTLIVLEVAYILDAYFNSA